MTSLYYVNFEISTSGCPPIDEKFLSILKGNVASVEVSEIDFLENMREVQYSYEEYNMRECRFLASYDKLHFLMYFVAYSGEFFYGARDDNRTGTLAGIPVFQVGGQYLDLLAILPKQISDEQFLSMIRNNKT